MGDGEWDHRSTCARCGLYLDDIERATNPPGLCWECKP